MTTSTTSAKVKLRAGLPDGEANGLTVEAGQFAEDPDTLRVAVVLLGTKAITEDRDTHDVTATVRVRRVEVIKRGDDVTALQRIMLRAHEERTGKTVLPLEMEGAVEEVFATWSAQVDADPDTGEVIE
jgi:hypothetical protein